MKLSQIIYLSSLLLCLLYQDGYTQSLIINNITVVDVEKKKTKSSMDVYVKDGMITRLSKHEKSRTYPSESKVIDGSGRFLMPGFIDTHAHFAMGPVRVSVENQKPVLSIELDTLLTKVSGELMLSHGITTARDPGGHTQSTVSTKHHFRKNLRAGPELYVAGSILDTSAFKNLATAVKTEVDVINEVRSQKNAGVDFVKLYTSLGPDMIATAIKEARRLGLGTVAHLHGTTWTEASELGIDNIVHIIPGSDYYLAEENRKEYQESLVWGSKAFFKWFELVDLKDVKIKKLLKTLKKNGTSIDPTLVVFHAAFFGNKNSYQSNELLDELPQSITDNWRNLFNFNVGWTEEDFDLAQSVWSKVEKFMYMIYEEGILLTAGTDANNPWIVPGDSFHQELELMVNAGIPTSEVLKIGTINGAKLLGVDKRLGSVSVGKEADLVILSANPLLDIKNTRRIERVIVNGVILD